MNTLRKLFSKDVHITPAQERKIPNAFGKTEAIYFDSIPSLGKETSVFAYIGVPDTDSPAGGFPAVVLVHGGGGIAFHEWVEYWNGKGYVALSFDTGGRQFGSRVHDSKGTAEQNPRGRYVQPDDNGSFGNDGSSFYDSWTYYNVANIILSNNILRARKDVNKEKIVLTGISWGGVLTAIASGIDDRFLAFAPVYGTGYLLSSQVYTKYDVPRPQDPRAWERLYGPENYVGNNAKPMLFTLGMDDIAFSPKNAQLTYENAGSVTYSYRYTLPHYHRWQDDEQMIHIPLFMDRHCKGGSLPFEVIAEHRFGNNFSVCVDNPKAIRRADFNYTLSSDSDCMLWKWEKKALSFEGNAVSITIPEDVKYCFIELSDGAHNEFILSSSLQIME